MEKLNPVLSVIIPLYNCGPVVNRCLDSIDFDNAEIIVIDDGSTDDSNEIVRTYADSHSNVRLVHKENGGVSSARNVGIELATGKYIVFVDADDYLSCDGLFRVIELAERYDADIVKYKILTSFSGGLNDISSVDKVPSLKAFTMEDKLIIGRAVALERYDISDYHVVDALFKLSVIKENHIQFDEDLCLREDDVFMGKFYCAASRVVVTNLPLYNYSVASPYSSTHNQSVIKNKKLVLSGYLAIQHRNQYIREHLPERPFPYERYKYMRWVCSSREAVEAGYSYREYISILEKFKDLGVWPVSYKWIRIAGFDYSVKIYVKKIIKTFLLNHPIISYPISRFRLLKFK